MMEENRKACTDPKLGARMDAWLLLMRKQEDGLLPEGQTALSILGQEVVQNVWEHINPHNRCPACYEKFMEFQTDVLVPNLVQERAGELGISPKQLWEQLFKEMELLISQGTEAEAHGVPLNKFLADKFKSPRAKHTQRASKKRKP